MGLACRDVSFAYREGGRQIQALQDVSFEMSPGSSTALLGASGSGKSTLLQIIRGLDEADAGEIVLDGAGRGSPGLTALRREVGLVFQSPEVQLFAATARDDVAFGPRRLGWSESEVAVAVSDAFSMVGLHEVEYGERHPYALSGGEQRRLALAGVLAMRPRLILLDEPFVSLDPGTRKDLVATLEGLKAQGVSLLLVTHDIDLAWQLCDQRVLMAEGGVVGAGPWDPSGSDERLLLENRLREPFLVELWRRLGRPLESTPRTVLDAARALA
jgi:energy-coupling factor transporter ATP-binding protein EcfA2